MMAGSPQAVQRGRGRLAHAIAALAGGLLLAGLMAAPGHAQVVCWYGTAQKMPEAAIAACDKVIGEKAWNRVVDGKAVENTGFRSAVYLSRAMARFELMTKKRTVPAADVHTALADLDQSIAASPQEMAHFMRAVLYERLSRMNPAERALYRGLAVREAKAAMAFDTKTADATYRKIIRDNQ